MKTLKNVFLVALFAFPVLANAVLPNEKNLPIGLAAHEKPVINKATGFRAEAPKGIIHALGEWEDSDGIMTLWVNADLINEYQKNGPTYLLADNNAGKNFWVNYLNNNNIPDENVSYFVTPTNSIWIRDYGPWFFYSSEDGFGMVDQIYNRPRPLDDVVPKYLETKLGIKRYDLELVHTGGNFYADGVGNAYSSTLVYSENPDINTAEVKSRMEKFVGVGNYFTNDLNPGVTIQHIDTHFKLVAPDTFVMIDFPNNSQYKADVEEMYQKLKTMTSPYGTPYKIHKIPATKKSGGFGTDYRAYVNAFISNRTLFFPRYGNNGYDQVDLNAKAIFEKALPGYKVVGVDAKNTGWGDSVHCRSRNIHKQDTMFVFPKVEYTKAAQKVVVNSYVYPSPGAFIAVSPTLYWSINNGDYESMTMDSVEENFYSVEIPDLNAGDKLKFYIKTGDTRDITKTAPINAPYMTIDLAVE